MLALLAIVARRSICVSLLGYNSGPDTGAPHRDHRRPQLELILPRWTSAFLHARLPLLQDSGGSLERQEVMSVQMKTVLVGEKLRK